MNAIMQTLWHIVTDGTLSIAGFLAMITILAFYLAPVILVIGFFVMLRQYRREHFGEGAVDGIMIADAHFYAPNHIWISHGKQRARVGVDDIARRILGRVERVVLPEPGTKLAKGEAAATVLLAGGRSVTLKSPVEGTVSRVNMQLASDPGLIEQPYTVGWFFEVEPQGDAHHSLPTGDFARRWFAREEARFARTLEREFGLAAADGGRLVAPPQELLSNEKWQDLVSNFLA